VWNFQTDIVVTSISFGQEGFVNFSYTL